MGIKARQYRYTLTGRHGFFSGGMLIVALALLFVVFAVAAVVLIKNNRNAVPPVSALYKGWEAQEYQKVYELSSRILEKRPLDGTVLAFHGFASYYLFVEQIDPAEAQNYLLTSINSLRNALYRVAAHDRPRISYVLGKAYYHRGYYYADLSLKYLEIAHNASFSAPDLAEFRGLAAASLGDYETSTIAFTEALSENPSDMLLFAIASNYLKLEETEKSKQYLYEVINKSADEILQLQCRNLLGTILFSESRIDEARAEFETIIQKDPNSADAHYGLGVIYESQGDLVRARASWRRALRSDPVHSGARSKLNL